MRQAAAVLHDTDGTSVRERMQARLFKNDHPRRIDTYIDYFGGAADRATSGSEELADVCGDGLLEEAEGDR